MPGSHKSIKKEDTYDALKGKGYSKSKAAAIANAQAAGTINHRGGRRKGKGGKGK